MERALKERLVGAAVLVAVVVLVLPEMLTGQVATPPPRSTRDTDGLPLHTHEFTLGETPTADQVAVAQDALQPEPAPVIAPVIASVSAPASAAVSATEPMPQPAASRPQPAASAAAVPPTTPRAEPAPATASLAPVAVSAAPAAVPSVLVAKTPASKPAASKPAAAVLAGWVVQIGSFSTQQKAEQFVAALRGKGYRAFTLPYTANGRTLHRVRVGPEQERAAVDELARRLRADGFQGSIAPQ
jgi:DedD protein